MIKFYWQKANHELHACIHWRHAPEMQLCFNNRKSQWLKNKVRFLYAQQNSFIKLMHMAASVRETRAVGYTNNSTVRLIENKNNSEVSYHNQMSNLQAHS